MISTNSHGIPFLLFGSGTSSTALSLFCFLERLASLMANPMAGSLWNQQLSYTICHISLPTSRFFFLSLVFCCFASPAKV